MKVGFFHDHFFYEKDDTIYTTGTLNASIWSRFLINQSIELIVCARKTQEKSCGEIASRDNVTFRFSHSLSNIKSICGLDNKELINKTINEVDLVVARLPSEIGFYAVNYAKKINKKTICEVVGCPYDGLNNYGSFVARIYAPIIKKRMKKIVASCDGALYVTEKILQNRYPNHGKVVSASNVQIESVARECIDNRISRFNERKENNNIKIGMIGSFKNGIKGIDVAIDALKNTDYHLYIIGSGDSSKYEEMANKSRVKFYSDGFITKKEDVLKWLDDIDIYIQPSFQEGLPRATIEAMSRGCPVISSNAGGLPELTLNKYIHTSGDFNKLRDDIHSIVANKNKEVKESINHSLSKAQYFLNTILEDRRKSFYSYFINIDK